MRLLDGLKDILAQPFTANCAIVALDIGVLLRLTGLYVLNGDATFLGPDQLLATDVFRAVVDPYCAGLAAPFNDPVQAPDDPFGWQREVEERLKKLRVLA